MRDLIRKGAGVLVQFYKNLSIRLKLLAVLNAVILVSLVSIGYFSYKASERVIQEKSIQYTQDILKTIELRLTDNIRNLNTIAQNVISDENIYPAIDSPVSDSLAHYEEDYAIGDVMKNIIINVNEVQSISIVSDNGAYFSADNNKTKVSIKTIIPPGGTVLSQLRQRALAAEGSPVWYLDMQNNKLAHLLYARIIYSRDTYRPSGMLVILVNSDYFDSVFNALENKDMRNVEVVAPDNTVIFSKAASQAGYTVPTPALSRMKGDGWLIDTAGKALISYTEMQSPDWKVVSFVPLDILYRDLYDIRRKMFLTCLFAIFFMSVFSFSMAYDFITSINKLIRGMKKVEQGDDDVRIELGRKDEIGYLGDAFNNMVREISMLEKWIYREQLTRKEAELKSLQAQINPHFLFNTLESINWMAQLEKAPKISETVTALASLMEASIARDDKLITLDEELSYIDNYMRIMKNRFEDRLELTSQIDEAARGIRIPKLLLQPLVENAVLHGTCNSRGKGIVRLRAAVEDGFLTMEVEDNGAGIESGLLMQINRNLETADREYYEGLSDGDSGSVGLKNVNKRIKLFYGDRYGLKIESEKNVFTRILIRIPTHT